MLKTYLFIPIGDKYISFTTMLLTETHTVSDIYYRSSTFDY